MVYLWEKPTKIGLTYIEIGKKYNNQGTNYPIKKIRMLAINVFLIYILYNIGAIVLPFCEWLLDRTLDSCKASRCHDEVYLLWADF